MKIVLCTKQVPSVEDVGFDPQTRTLVREGVANEINPFDRRALGQAIALKEQLGAEIIAVTMGPPQAEEVLRECLSVGADRAVHIADRALAGSDTLITARVLAAFLRREAPDLVFCGKYSVDAETGQVGPEVAELLGMAQVTGATTFQLSADGRSATVGRETDAGIDTVEVGLPVLLTAAERLTRPPRVTPEMLEGVRGRPIEHLSAADLGFTADEVGLRGSPTWVSEIYSAKAERQPVLITAGADPAEAARQLVDHLLERGLFGTWGEDQSTPLPSETTGSAEKSVWAIVDVVDGQVDATSLELLGGAADVAAQVGGQVAAVLLGHGVSAHVPQLAMHGADVVYLADDPRLAQMDPRVFTHVLAAAILLHKPWAVLAPANSNGREYTPRVAARLGLGLTGDAIGLEVKDGALVQLKPAFGGTIVAPILSKTSPQLATVRPGALQRRPANGARRARVLPLSLDGLPAPQLRLVNREVQGGEAALALDHADIVVGAGAGLGSLENLSYVYELAEVLGAAVGGTRRVVDSGWLPRQQQIGLTGKVIAPQLYIGVAVRGAFNHSIGIQKAKTVVAINNDPTALVFSAADFGIVGEYQSFVPAFVAALQAAKASMADARVSSSV